jgi:CHAT domain-containing protein
MHGLPLHALLVGGVPLAALHPVAYVPAAGLLALAQNPSKGTDRLDSCASFGIVFEEEARAVAERFGGELIDAGILTPASIAQLCRGKDVCHFSCHGFFDPADPLSSGLIVADDADRDEPGPSILTARDVMAMRLRSELVCLSACETGVSEATEGDELLGLIRAFLYAGASSIVASLWSVDAATTRDLMWSFYDHLLDQYAHSGSIDKAAALQASQLEIMRRVGSRSSFLWAPFLLIGDWR